MAASWQLWIIPRLDCLSSLPFTSDFISASQTPSENRRERTTTKEREREKPKTLLPASLTGLNIEKVLVSSLSGTHATPRGFGCREGPSIKLAVKIRGIYFCFSEIKPMAIELLDRLM